ncbi:phosphotransferase [Brevibacterium sp. 91QC2O2]|uniref:phosphotransferase n=1 Tax=Brevibacterium sp. 91QC2O2 TaxID=2968458 RepID=UPI00211CCD52|nr:phosphotransferase [Brevibacterium sp. 91QC2O2]
MDNLPLHMAAAASHLVDGLSPTQFSVLDGTDRLRVLVGDGDRFVLASLLDPTDALEAQTEQVAAAVLRTILPSDSPAFPETLATQDLKPGTWSLDREYELRITRPLPGTPLSTAAFTEHPGLVDSLARFLARLHTADVAAVADAGLPTREPLEVRDSLLAELDRGAQTGKVPGALLQRWEETLETAAVWHFLPAVLHGDLGIDALRTTGDDLVAVTDLARVRVGDPAHDLAGVADLMSTEDFIRLLDVYLAERRMDDPYLVERVGLVSEMGVLGLLLACADADDAEGVDEAVELLRSLAELPEDAPEPGPGVTADSSAAEAAEESETGVIDRPSSVRATDRDPAGPQA